MSKTSNDKASFSKYGKTFQEKLTFIILDDRAFADRMVEVLNVEFLEYKYLQSFVEKIFQYKRKYGSQPSHETMKTMIKSGIDDLNDVLQKQIRDYYARVLSNINVLESAEYIKDTALDFCRKQKLREAMLKSSSLLQRCSFDEISVLINDALKAGADADFGYDYINAVTFYIGLQRDVNGQLQILFAQHNLRQKLFGLLNRFTNSNFIRVPFFRKNLFFLFPFQSSTNNIFSDSHFCFRGDFRRDTKPVQ